MTIDYHIHLEEGPYSVGWLERTAKAMAFFAEDKRHTVESVRTFTEQLHERVQRGSYSTAWLDLYLQRAKQLGLKEVGIVDHLYRFEDALEYYKKHMHLGEDLLGKMQGKWLSQVNMVPALDSFIESIQSQKEKWEKEGVTLRLGIEADFFPHGEEELEQILSGKPWDYVIGSVHFVNGWGFDNPEAKYMFEQENVMELYETHTTYLCQAIESELFDIIAHLDNLKVFSYRPKEEKLQHCYEKVAKTLKEYQVASEINTGLSYRYPIKEACPSPSYIQTLAKYNIPMTLSSDSHFPDDVGTNLEQAIQLLKSTGYKQVVGFAERKRYNIELS